MGTITGTAGADTIDTYGVSASVTVSGGGVSAGADSILANAGDDYVHAGGGNDTLNGGDGNDTLFGAGGNDTLLGGSNNDALFGGAGDDTLSGDAGNDSVNGGIGDDILFGGSGSDVLLGGAGADDLIGGTGNDTLDGGDGNDFMEDQTATAGVANNQLMLGGAGDDRLGSRDGSDTLDGGEGTDEATFSLSTAAMFIDLASGLVAGRGGPNGGAVVLISIEEVTSGSGADTVLGSDGADRASLSGGADSALGGLGNDTLLGGDGNDRLFGEAGDDSASGGNDGDTLDGGAGNDTLFGGFGSLSGADSLLGGDGDDELLGDAGADTLDGGNGLDIMSIGGSVALAVDLGAATVADGTGATDRIQNIEGVIGSSTADTLTGNTAANVLDGGVGNDLLFGRAGFDTLVGGFGNDTLAGEEDADSLDGGAGNDALDGGAGEDTLNGGDSNDTLDGGDGADELRGGIGNDALSGGLLNDLLLAEAGNDTLDGGDGVDTMDAGDGQDRLVAGSGSDLILGGAGSDTLSFAASVAAVQVTLAGAGLDGRAQGGGFGGADTIRDVETVEGGAGNDFLQLDLLTARALGGAGNDTVVAFVGNVINQSGGDGRDLLRVYDTVEEPFAINLVDLGAFSLASFEEAEGTFNRDNIVGNAAANRLLGLGGDDALTGGAGDTLDGGAGNDIAGFADSAGIVFTPGAAAGSGSVEVGGGTALLLGIETVEGGDGNDLLLGRLDGPTGSLGLRGSFGADTLDGRGSLANLAIYSSSAVVDLQAGTAQGSGIGADLLIGVRAVEGAGTIKGTAETEWLAGNVAGNASIAGGGGADTLDGAAGADTLLAGSTAGFAGTALLSGGSGADLLEGRASGAAGDRVYLDPGSGTNDTIRGFGRIENVADFGTIAVSGGFVIDLATGSASVTFDGVRAVRANILADTLIGTGFDEEFDVGAGADTVTAGAGRDRIAWSTLTTGIRADLAAGTAVEADGTLDRFTGVEDAAGSAFADTLLGTAEGNLFAPLGGNDSLDGRGGNDTVSYAEVYRGVADPVAGVTVNLAQRFALDPWGGTDLLRSIEAAFGTALGDELVGAVLAGGGQSLLRGNAGADLIRAVRADTGATADYAADPGAVRVNLSLLDQEIAGETLAGQTALDGFGDTDLFILIQAARGSAFADTMIGGTTADTLIGGAGADSLRGAEGDDVLEGGAGADVLAGGTGARDQASHAAAAAAVKASLAAPGTGTGDAAGDSYTGIEDLGGSPFDDTLIGDSNANQLIGRVGDDDLQGLGGADTLLGGAGDDVLTGGAAADRLDGGDGLDIASYEGAAAAVAASLNAPGGNTGDAAGDSYIAIEGLRGSALADRLNGNGAANLLEGLGGADTLVGAGAADTLTGGAGADRFLWNGVPASGDADLVTDFASGADKLAFAAAAFGGLAVGTLSTLSFSSGTAASSPGASTGPQFVYQATTGALFYDANGAGGADAVRIATLQNGGVALPTLLNTDILIV
jgi:Ca2+-binding RTX toxin-like protein